MNHTNKVPRWIQTIDMKQNTSPDAIYYERWKIVIGSRMWRLYLRWAYKTCLDDLRKLHFYPDFTRQDFTALLCGVGNEVTADEFICFVLGKNNNAHIIIIDVGTCQIDAVTKLVQKKYQLANITVKRIDALQLSSFISNNTVDWIETDGFLEFFNKNDLKMLLAIWKKILKVDGYITLREPASDNMVGTRIDYLRIWIAKLWLGVAIYRHTKKELEKMLTEQLFAFVSAHTIVPTFKRYSIIKSRQTI